MIRSRSLAALLCAAALSACGSDTLPTIATPATGAQIKFYNFAVNAPGVNFYAGSTKMTAILSSCTTNCTETTTGTVFGGVGNGGFYTLIAPGQYTITARIAATTDKDLVVSTAPVTVVDGKYYSLFTTGFYNTTTKAMDAFVIEDVFPAQIDYTVAYVRFVNVISNSSPMTLFAKNTSTNAEMAVGSEVGYRNTGAFVAVPQGVYDLNTRTTGSAANAITRTAVSFVAGRTYTISSRGDMTVTSTTATNRPQLDNTINR